MLFGYFDLTWVSLILFYSVLVNLDGYIMSYGQVWPPSFHFRPLNADQTSACLGVSRTRRGTHSLCDYRVHLFPLLGYTQFSPTSPKPVFGQGSEVLYPQEAESSYPGPSSLQCYFIPQEARRW